MRQYQSISFRISLLLLIILVMIPVNYYFVDKSIQIIKHDAFAINHIGMVRGSIQRMVKLAETGSDTAAIQEFIDGVLNNIETRYIDRPENRSYLERYGFLAHYRQMVSCWDEIKTLIHRTDRHDALIRTSEACWEYADKTAATAQEIAETKRQDILNAFFLRVAIVFLLILLIITYVIVKVRKGLEQDVRLDPLTQAYNRTHFIERLEYHTALAHRSARPLSLLFIDIDHFKQINDTLGHQVGDRLLVAFVTALKRSLRASDMLFRFGGEEFVVIAPECDLECARPFGEKLRLLIAQQEWEEALEMSVSVGIAQLGKHESASELIKRADDAMYLAKKAGRNRVIAV